MAKKLKISSLDGDESQVANGGDGGVRTGEKSPRTARRAPGVPLKSPMHFMPDVSTADPLRSNVSAFPLPVSGGTVEARLQELDPKSCFASPLNPRVQQLLSVDDPWVAELARAIKTEGQRDPVLVRPVPSAEGVRFEVIYGTTRLFIATNWQLPLKAWVAEIPDGDARRLARIENKERRDLSAWEKSLDLREQQSGGVYIGKTHEYIAEQEQMSRSNVTKLMRLADIDLTWLQLLVSPHAMSVKSGNQMLTLIESLDGAQRERALSFCREFGPYRDASHLLAKLKEFQQSQHASVVRVDPRKPVLVPNGKGDPVLRVTAHRSNAGQFKVDLFEFSDADIQELIDFVKSKRGLN